MAITGSGASAPSTKVGGPGAAVLPQWTSEVTPGGSSCPIPVLVWFQGVLTSEVLFFFAGPEVCLSASLYLPLWSVAQGTIDQFCEHCVGAAAPLQARLILIVNMECLLGARHCARHLIASSHLNSEVKTVNSHHSHFMAKKGESQRN